MNIAGSFVTPNGITTYSKCPYLDLNDIFWTSSGLTKIWWYPDHWSILEKTSVPFNWSSRSSILGSGYLFL